MATPFFGTEYTMDHLGLPSELRSRIEFRYYRSGHMIYLNEKELPKSEGKHRHFYRRGCEALIAAGLSKLITRAFDS